MAKSFETYQKAYAGQEPKPLEAKDIDTTTLVTNWKTSVDRASSNVNKTLTAKTPVNATEAPAAIQQLNNIITTGNKALSADFALYAQQRMEPRILATCQAGASIAVAEKLFKGHRQPGNYQQNDTQALTAKQKTQRDEVEKRLKEKDTESLIAAIYGATEVEKGRQEILAQLDAAHAAQLKELNAYYKDIETKQFDRVTASRLASIAEFNARHGEAPDITNPALAQLGNATDPSSALKPVRRDTYETTNGTKFHANVNDENKITSFSIDLKAGTRGGLKQDSWLATKLGLQKHWDPLAQDVHEVMQRARMENWKNITIPSDQPRGHKEKEAGHQTRVKIYAEMWAQARLLGWSEESITAPPQAPSPEAQNAAKARFAELQQMRSEQEEKAFNKLDAGTQVALQQASQIEKSLLDVNFQAQQVDNLQKRLGSDALAEKFYKVFSTPSLDDAAKEKSALEIVQDSLKEEKQALVALESLLEQKEMLENLADQHASYASHLPEAKSKVPAGVSDLGARSEEVRQHLRTGINPKNMSGVSEVAKTFDFCARTISDQHTEDIKKLDTKINEQVKTLTKTHHELWRNLQDLESVPPAVSSSFQENTKLMESGRVKNAVDSYKAIEAQQAKQNLSMKVK